jgi:hypothetical protein
MENISTAGRRQENTDEGNTPLHKEMFAMNFLVLKKVRLSLRNNMKRIRKIKTQVRAALLYTWKRSV